MKGSDKESTKTVGCRKIEPSIIQVIVSKDDWFLHHY